MNESKMPNHYVYVEIIINGQSEPLKKYIHDIKKIQFRGLLDDEIVTLLGYETESRYVARFIAEEGYFEGEMTAAEFNSQAYAVGVVIGWLENEVDPNPENQAKLNDLAINLNYKILDIAQDNEWWKKERIKTWY